MSQDKDFLPYPGCGIGSVLVADMYDFVDLSGPWSSGKRSFSIVPTGDFKPLELWLKEMDEDTLRRLSVCQISMGGFDLLMTECPSEIFGCKRSRIVDLAVLARGHVIRIDLSLAAGPPIDFYGAVTGVACLDQAPELPPEIWRTFRGEKEVLPTRNEMSIGQQMVVGSPDGKGPAIFYVVGRHGRLIPQLPYEDDDL